MHLRLFVFLIISFATTTFCSEQFSVRKSKIPRKLKKICISQSKKSKKRKQSSIVVQKQNRKQKKIRIENNNPLFQIARTMKSDNFTSCLIKCNGKPVRRFIKKKNDKKKSIRELVNYYLDRINAINDKIDFNKAEINLIGVDKIDIEDGKKKWLFEELMLKSKLELREKKLRGENELSEKQKKDFIKKIKFTVGYKQEL